MVENHFDKNGDTGSSVDSITNIKMRKKQTKVSKDLKHSGMPRQKENLKLHRELVFFVNERSEGYGNY